MPLTLVTQTSFVTTEAQSSISIIPSVLQGIMEGYGWHQMNTEIYEAEQAEQISDQRLYLAVQGYIETPDAEEKIKLISVLKEERRKKQKQYQNAIVKQRYYEKEAINEAGKKQNTSVSYILRLMQSVREGVKDFFSSSNEELAKKYKNNAVVHAKKMKKLSYAIDILEDTQVSEMALEEFKPSEIPVLEKSSVIEKSPLFPEEIQLSELKQFGFKIDGENPGDFLGWSFSLGKLKGEKYSLLLSAPGHNNLTGRNYIISEDTKINNDTLSLSTLNSLVLDGEKPGELTGNSVSFIGDFNGDFYPDVLISAIDYYNGFCRNYLVFGSYLLNDVGLFLLSHLNGINGFAISNEAQKDFCGTNGAGDVNRDGYSDVLVGITEEEDGAGKAYLLFGGPLVGKNGVFSLSNLTGKDGVEFNGISFGDETGYSIGGIGYFNGDDYPDFGISAPARENATGSVYVVFGNSVIGINGELPLSDLNGRNGFEIIGEMPQSFLGGSFSSGDFNGDRYRDLLIGAELCNDMSGCSYVILGGPNLFNSIANGQLLLNSLNTRAVRIYGETPGDYSGASLDTAGDMNGDGYEDLIIGAKGYDNYRGCSYVIYGGPSLGNKTSLYLSNLTRDQGFKIIGEKPYSYSGFAVGGGGDLNGDNRTDLVITAPTYNKIGRAYVVYGQAENSTIPIPPVSEPPSGSDFWKIPVGAVGGALGLFFMSASIKKKLPQRAYQSCRARFFRSSSQPQSTKPSLQVLPESKPLNKEEGQQPIVEMTAIDFRTSLTSEVEKIEKQEVLPESNPPNNPVEEVEKNEARLHILKN